MQAFYSWASLTTRLWKGSEHLEVEWTVGPIPFRDGLGREISVRPFAFLRLALLHSLIHVPCAQRPLEAQYMHSWALQFSSGFWLRQSLSGGMLLEQWNSCCGLAPWKLLVRMPAIMSDNPRRALESLVVLQVRYESNITSKDTFYTDSNGREMLKRVRDYRPTWKLEVNEPVSGNYYPLTAGMYLKVSFP